MKVCYWGKDGGPESNCLGFWPIEIKSLFSVALLKFDGKSREAYHNHAFHSVSWVLTGGLKEEFLNGQPPNIYRPSLRPVLTRRSTFHRVSSPSVSWVLTFRGPWTHTWNESRSKQLITLTHGRKEV